MTELKTGGAQGYLRIATEEAFAPPELMAAYAEVLDGKDVDPGFESLMGFYMRHKSERATNIFRRLQDLGAERIADMDARGIDRQVIGMTAPGVQILCQGQGDGDFRARERPARGGVQDASRPLHRHGRRARRRIPRTPRRRSSAR